MQTFTGNAEAARRIVAINAELARPLALEDRNRLVSEQRTIWDSLFQGCTYEDIADTVH